MKEVRTYSNVESILIGDRPIIQRADSAYFINDDLNLELILESEIFYSRVINKNFYFQIGSDGNLNTLSNGKVNILDDVWGLITALSISPDRLYIFSQKNENDPKFLIVSNTLQVVKESVPNCNYAADGFLFQCYGNTISCFDEETGKEKWRVQLEAAIDQRSISFNAGCMFFTIKSTSMCMDISSGKFKWKTQDAGRITLFEDKIYGIGDQTLKEFDAKNGNILRQQTIQSETDAYSFWATGEHKVYDQYIFSMATGRPGMISIYDRKSLRFQELLKLEEMIPTGKSHLHWHNNRLFVLDFSKNVHVYESGI